MPGSAAENIGDIFIHVPSKDGASRLHFSGPTDGLLKLKQSFEQQVNPENSLAENIGLATTLARRDGIFIEEKVTTTIVKRDLARLIRAIRDDSRSATADVALARLIMLFEVSGYNEQHDLLRSAAVIMEMREYIESLLLAMDERASDSADVLRGWMSQEVAYFLIPPDL